jgi:hypothetical protein
LRAVIRHRLALALAIVLLAVPAASAGAQDGNPFDGVPPPAPTPAPTLAPVEESNDDVGRNTLYAIAGGLLVAFVIVGWWMSRDARRALPPEERRERDRLREEGPHRKARQAKAKARAKGRAQRQARRRTRR